MNTNYEDCPVNDATHARLASGEVEIIHIAPPGDCFAGLRYVSAGFGDICHETCWQRLGIQPVKPVPPPQPMEFVGEARYNVETGEHGTMTRLWSITEKGKAEAPNG